MSHVRGVGGVFFKVASPEAHRDWYRRVLGFEFEEWGGQKFPPLDRGCTVWSAFPRDTRYFDPGTVDFMLNLVVDDLDATLAHAKAMGVEPLGRDDNDPNGQFAWLLDPDGIKIELWQPKG
jgi:catechol 2,3-dioxygenase-like lactoylglutathione lyase family enzyme